MNSALSASPGVRLFQQAASYYGLGYTSQTGDEVTVPAYTAPIRLEYAKALSR
jgi:uncharacterized protein YlxW (UPF0749 family)